MFDAEKRADWFANPMDHALFLRSSVTFAGLRERSDSSLQALREADTQAEFGVAHSMDFPANSCDCKLPSSPSAVSVVETIDAGKLNELEIDAARFPLDRLKSHAK